MRSFHRGSLAIDAFVIVTLIFYFAFAWLPLVFTFEWLPVTAIPFYSTDNIGYLGGAYSDRYNMEFWIFFTDVFRFIYPFGMEYIKTAEVISYSPENRDVTALGYFAFFLVEIIKLGYRGYVWWFCVDFQFCRNYVPGDCNQKFDCEPNAIWFFVFWYNLFFVIMCMVYIGMITMVLAQARDFINKLEQGLIHVDVDGPEKKETMIETIRSSFIDQGEVIYMLPMWKKR